MSGNESVWRGATAVRPRGSTKLLGKIYGYLIKEFLVDIGTRETYKRANESWVDHDKRAY